MGETSIDERGLPGFVHYWTGAQFVCSIEYLYMACVCWLIHMHATVYLALQSCWYSSFLNSRKSFLHIYYLKVSLPA